MMKKHTIATPKIPDAAADLDDLADRLMAEDRWTFLIHIPRHGFAGAYPADSNLRQRLARPDPRNRPILDPDIIERITPGNFHFHGMNATFK